MVTLVDATCSKNKVRSMLVPFRTNTVSNTTAMTPPFNGYI